MKQAALFLKLLWLFVEIVTLYLIGWHKGDAAALEIRLQSLEAEQSRLETE